MALARNRRIDGVRRDKTALLDAEEPSLQPAGTPDLDSLVDSQVKEDKIRAALESLPVEQLTLVRMAFFENLSHSQIAEKADLPLGTVKSRIRLAFTRLRRALEAEGIAGV
jgi:RNA polymerase sigma factor (sigma-70 family)